VNAVAHDALVEHGWRRLGETQDHTLRSADVDAYGHGDFAGRINVASTGEWEHTNPANANMPAQGTTTRQLARYLSAIHATASIADLHLPGRKDGDD
jgi:hypothetical protein